MACQALRRSLLWAGVFAASFFWLRTCSADAPPNEEVAAALADLDVWLGTGRNGDQWRRYIHADSLARQLDRENPDIEEVEASLRRLNGAATGLDDRRFVRLQTALRAWVNSQPPPALSDLVRDTNAAVDAFSPPDPTELATARGRLTDAMSELDEYLAAGGKREPGWDDAWKQFLYWPVLAEGAAAETPDLRRLQFVRGRFRRNQLGLESSPYRDVANALDNYIAALNRASADTLRDQFGQQLGQLAGQLEAFEADPTPERVEAMADAVDWLESRRQAPALVALLRRRFARPNLLVETSGDFVAAAADRRLDETAPVRDMILGTTIRGTGTTTGSVTVHLVPDPRQAAFELTMSGVNRSQNVGYNGPAVIYSRGTTQLSARKRIYLTADGIESLPTVADAEASSRITGVSSTRNGPLGCIVRRAAEKRIPKQKRAAERIASRHAAERLDEQFDSESGEQLAKANRSFLQRFRDPLVRRAEHPERLELSTTANALHLLALQRGAGRLAAWTDPPALNGSHSVSLRLHQSLVDNVADGLLAGETLDQPRLEKIAKDLTGEVPERLKPDPDADPWSMTLASERPVTLRIDDGAFRVTVRGRRYTSADKAYPAMDFSVAYRVEHHGDEVKFIRIGDVEFHSPGGSGLRQSVLKSLMQRRLAKILTPEIVSPGIELPEQFGADARLAPVQVGVDNGWVVVGWNQTNGAPRTQSVARLADAGESP